MIRLYSRREWCTISILVTCVLLENASCGSSAETLKLERVSIRLSYRDQHERMTRRSAFAEAPEFGEIGVESVGADANDMLTAQVSCTDEETGEAGFAQQSFLRFVRTDTGQDSVYVMRKKNIESRLELNLLKEIQTDKTFWAHDVTYRVEIVVGDTRMPVGVRWIAVESLQFTESKASYFGSGARGVFDFDVGVSKVLLPEFTSPLPADEKEAPLFASLLALAALLCPFPLVLVAWSRLGVFPLSLPKASAERSSVIAFETCLLAHMATLVMFWLQWSIVLTWKVMAFLMLPTMFFGHRTLSPAASRHVRQMSALKKQK